MRARTPTPELTDRQREVAALVAKGKTNAEIGATLDISLDGAKYHVSELMAKLGVDSREEIAHAWRAENTLASRASRATKALLQGIGWKAMATGAGLLAIGGVVLAVALAGGDGPPEEVQANLNPTPGGTTTPASDILPRVNFTFEYETLMGFGGLIVRDGPCFYLESPDGTSRQMLVFYASEDVHSYDAATDILSISGQPVPFNEMLVVGGQTFEVPPQSEWATTFQTPPDPACLTDQVHLLFSSFTVTSADRVIRDLGEPAGLADAVAAFLAADVDAVLALMLVETFVFRDGDGQPVDTVRIEQARMSVELARGYLSPMLDGNPADCRAHCEGYARPVSPGISPPVAAPLR